MGKGLRGVPRSHTRPCEWKMIHSNAAGAASLLHAIVNKAPLHRACINIDKLADGSRLRDTLESLNHESPQHNFKNLCKI